MSPMWIVLTMLPILGGAERFNCRGRILGAYYADAKSGCKAFHVCVRVAGGGVRDFRFFCPPGTLFHQEAQTCTDWGDDDPLACPVDIYDGQFDLYRIGSGFDTKKVSPSGVREEETEFGLQRAETGDRRLTQNNAASNAASSDLRTAHSSDFYTGQRERGRDDPAPQPSSIPPSPRQTFRRPASTRPPQTTQYTPTVPTTTPPATPSQTKRKLVRKRPIYVSTAAPPKPVQNLTPQIIISASPQQNYDQRIVSQNKLIVPPANIPPQYKDYKDEYVEVSRVTPKTRGSNGKSYSPTFVQTTSTPQYNKKETLIELYNHNAQSNPKFKGRADNKFKNNPNVSPDLPNEYTLRGNIQVSSNGAQDAPITPDINNVVSRGFTTSTASYRNFNSVSYEPEKKTFNSSPKQNYFSSSVTTPSTAITTYRAETPSKINTVAYNTNLGINAQFSNYAGSEEDDGQYRPPEGEDDGQYRPELYEKELLTGAHSLNIAASRNRLPEDQKPRGKSQPPNVETQTSPRPFRPSPTFPPIKQSRVTEYTTTFAPSTSVETRTFDYFQTYTTTSRPSDIPGQPYSSDNRGQARPTTTSVTRATETRASTRAPVPTSPPVPARPTKAPHFARPANNKEDNSYDYAYYDSDTGFSEYDHIEEFGKTKTRV